jgi:hypothetical protein
MVNVLHSTFNNQFSRLYASKCNTFVLQATESVAGALQAKIDRIEVFSYQ